MVFSIRLTKEERALADSYAKLHSLSIGEAFKRALFEKIEDEYDIAIAEEAHREFEESGGVTYDYDEFMRSLDDDV